MIGPVLAICLKVFFCRILDVSIGTVRTIQLVKGKKYIAALCGFAEVFIWFTIVREALTSDMGGIFIALSYAAGFSAGTFIGSFLSEKLIIHKVCVQIVTGRRDRETLHAIRERGYAVSTVEVLPSEFSEGKYLLIIEIDSRRLKALRKLINTLDDHAFIMVHESSMVYNGYFAK